jgi:CubicO group peptidase (beta-lactamase class C family)
MKNSVFNFILFLTLTNSLPANHVAESDKIRKIDSFMTALYNRGQFTGAILVADHGKLIYKKGFGLANRETTTSFIASTPEYIGSISKQFTAMGIMILKDKGRLNYHQHIRQFFPELPACMEQVTIRHLLYHISGLALFDDFPDMTEKDVFTILLKQQSLRFTPGEKFEYCNGGYSLLGMIIEKITGESLHNFMATNIFKPLGMNQTSVNETGQPNKTRAVGYTMYGTINSYDTYMGGNASIISTVEDLYKWDQELYHCSLVKPATLTEAFTPSSLVMKNSALNLKDDIFKAAVANPVRSLRTE